MYSYSLFKIGQSIALSLPLKLCYAVATFFSDVHFIFADKDRADTWANLKTIFPDKSDKELRAIRLKMFRNFAKYLVDFFRFPLMNKAFIEKNVRVENIEFVNEAIQKKKGVILLTAHIGNWELGGAVIAQMDYPLWAVALPHKSEEINAFFNSRREKKGIQVIPFGKAARTCFKILLENQMLALVGDRDFSNDGGEVITFFGKATYLPKGPAVLALKTGAAIVPGFMVRNSDDTFTLRFERTVEVDRQQSIEEVINNYKKIIENYIRAYPDQWFMFKKFWIE
ncbi:MAG TPA: lysophospholipid acyltransferase family protein [Candidatus Omnitrophota bacterium]|nr:lysophospholipid acyltransferase family protein [Candidatus Omnitrophota bacterium]HRZ14802.1 lysophospholipid acyltransferase family protein [Candidatus Omnitrophota bacterium]